MPLPALDPQEQRVIGVLLEKQVTVPATYPMTLSAVRTGCNQTSSREPVVDYDEPAVERTLRRLKELQLVRIVWADTGRRTLKYHQLLSEVLELDDAERAVLTVLLLRGPQAPGELRTRTERLHGFPDRESVEAVLTGLAARPEPLVRELPPSPGSRAERYMQLLCAELHDVDADGAVSEAAPAPRHDAPASFVQRDAGLGERVGMLEAEVAVLRDALRRLAAAVGEADPFTTEKDQ